MLADIKAQLENLRVRKNSSMLYQIIHLHINFYKLAVTQDSSYTELPKWIEKKKAVTYQNIMMKNTAALRYEEIKNHHERISLPRHYGDH